MLLWMVPAWLDSNIACTHTPKQRAYIGMELFAHVCTPEVVFVTLANWLTNKSWPVVHLSLLSLPDRPAVSQIQRLLAAACMAAWTRPHRGNPENMQFMFALCHLFKHTKYVAAWPGSAISSIIQSTLARVLRSRTVES